MSKSELLKERRLILLRHGKSSHDTEARDFDRPLAPRGRCDLPRVAVALGKQGKLPDLIIASSSQRTRETAELFVGAVEADIPIVYDDALYLASPREILRVIQAGPDDICSLMLVGHNPGFQSLAWQLGGPGFDPGKFPTAAAAVFRITADSWRDAPASPVLELYVKPSDLR